MSVAGLADLQRERRVDDVGGGQPVVEPAPSLVVELLADGVDERGGVVVERRSSSATRSGGRRRRGGDALPRPPRGTTPSSAQAAVAACSTSSHVASLPSSDQMLAMAGRE